MHAAKVQAGGGAHQAMDGGWAYLPQDLMLKVLDTLRWERSACSAMRATCVHWWAVVDTGVPSLMLNSWNSTRRFPSVLSLEVENCAELTDLVLRHELVTGHLTKLSALSLGCCSKLTEAGISSLQKLPALSQLHLQLCGSSVTLGALEELERLRGLRSLRLTEAYFDCRRCFVVIGRATALTSLRLDDCFMGDGFWECDCCGEDVDLSFSLSQLSRLTSLDLRDVDFSTLSSVQLTTLTSLKLTAEYPEEEDEAALLHLLLSNKALVSLDLDGYRPLSHDHLHCIRGLSALEKLSLCYDEDDGDLAQLFRATEALSELSLSDCGLLDGSLFEVLAMRTALKSLTLNGCSLYFEDVDEGVMCGMLSLTRLDLHGCGLQPPGVIAAIGQLTRLQALRLAGVDSEPNYPTRSYEYKGEIGDVLGGALSQLTGLTSLDLDAYAMTHRTAVSLGKPKHLVELTLTRCTVEKAGDNGFLTASIGTLTALRQLSLNGTRGLALARGGLIDLGSLTSLDLYGTEKASKASNGLHFTLRHLRALRTLKLEWHCKPAQPVPRKVLAGPWKSRLRTLVAKLPAGELSVFLHATDGETRDLMTLPDASLMELKQLAQQFQLLAATATKELERRSHPMTVNGDELPCRPRAFYATAYLEEDAVVRRIQSIAAMPEHRTTSPEELRWAVVSANRGAPAAAMPATVATAALLFFTRHLTWFRVLAFWRSLSASTQLRQPQPSPAPTRNDPVAAAARAFYATAILEDKGTVVHHIQSISAMPEHRATSPEELRWAVVSAARGARASIVASAALLVMRFLSWCGVRALWRSLTASTQPRQPQPNSSPADLAQPAAAAAKRGRNEESTKVAVAPAAVKQSCSCVTTLAALMETLPALSALHLHLHGADDRDVAALTDHRLTSLVTLRLQLNCELTDHGLRPLCVLPSLTEVNLLTEDAHSITDAGVRALRSARRHRPPFNLVVKKGTAKALGLFGV